MDVGYPKKSAQVITGGFWQDICQETLMKRSRFTETQIISMKVHVIDSGLAATLISLKPADWSKHSSDFGPILESFIVQQLICQATWQNSEINFSHYRDKDQVEVDLMIEHNREVWGVEVKKTASIRAKDGVGLSRLATQAC